MHPPGLKPRFLMSIYGTAEAVPLNEALSASVQA